MQYSVFAHGTSLQIESPTAIASSTVVGWGTILRFKAPVPQQFHDVTVYDYVGPGTWCHISIPCTHTTFGMRAPLLDSVTLLADTTHCRITDIHVYDGVDLLEAFGGFKGDCLRLRNPKDVNPETEHPWGTPTYANTKVLHRRPRLFSAVGISFYACAHFEDFNVRGYSSGPPWPEAILTFGGAGAQFYVPDLRVVLTDYRNRGDLEAGFFGRAGRGGA